MRFSLSLRTQLAIIFGGTTFLLICIFGVFYGDRSIKQVEVGIGNSLSEAAYLMENNLNQYMWSRYGETIMLSSLSDIRQLEDEEKIGSMLNQTQSTFPAFSWIGLTDQDGTVIASTDSILKGADISERPVYSEALEKNFIGDVHEAVLLADLLPNPTGEDMKFVDISTPIFDDANQFIGVLATHLSWEWVKEIETSMIDSLKYRDGIEFLIVSKIDDVVILGPDDLLGKPLDLESIELARTNKNGSITETWPNGKEYVTGYMLENGYMEYPGLGWTILVRQPVEVAHAPIKELVLFFLVSGLIFVVLFAVLGWFLAGRIASPLKDIASTADRLRVGELVQIPYYKGTSELETLSLSLRKLVSDLTSTESALVEMKEVATRDELTGLANRYALDAYLDEFIQKNKMAIVLYIDLDGFKLINDTLGHNAGDALLVQVAKRLKKSVRENEMVARVGGDEFVVVLPAGKESLDKRGELVGERMISSINKPYALNGEKVSVSCSIGAACWEASSLTTIGETIKTADEALYTAKREGKNRIHIYGY
ncbi:sensor domain-containing diguanylate cyclase [Planococcus faecalis]|uniref:sensor domain-containing diguanylate cyclase n=1 Tax=Planococcus faecalis TaxID=1598147 RepID=UPI0008DA919D|nr:diguanylate cyclase [Planococcus faecalis]OHX51620.1 diguanylate cyclase [Planococcus faecalis]